MTGNRKVIWAVHGGYGGQAVARELMASEFTPPFPKLLCGFSDVTVLGLTLNQKFGWPWLHCQIAYCSQTQETSGLSINQSSDITTVTQILTGEVTKVTYKLQPMNEAANDYSVEDSSLLGGNLSVIQRNYAGIIKDLDWSNKILVFEDTPENGKRAMDILCGMFDSDRFKDVHAILFGEMPIGSGSEEEEIEFIKEFDRSYLQDHGPKIPVYFYNRIGHGPFNDPIPMGTPATIRNCYLTIQTNS